MVRAFFYCAFSMVAAAWAQNPTSIQELAVCINQRLVNQGAADISQAVERCMPQGCKVTASMSQASAQPACVAAGVQLPRVYFNCPGPGPGLRFRPTFTLCANDPNRIETGEDVPPVFPSTSVPLRMANFDVPPNQPMLHEIVDYLNTPNNNIRCTRCHGNASPAATGDTPLLSTPFDPFTVQRRNLLPFVTFTNEPTRKALVAPTATVAGSPVIAQSLDQVCSKIAGALENNPFALGFSSPVQGLCQALAEYVSNRSCGNGLRNARCRGLTGGGIFVRNGASSTIALELSGQAVFDPESADRLVFKSNDIDGTLTAVNSTTQTTINAAAFSALDEIRGREGEGNFEFRGTGKAWINGTSTAIGLRVWFVKAEELSGVEISNPDSGDFYAGGTAVGVRFSVSPPPAHAEEPARDPQRVHRSTLLGR